MNVEFKWQVRLLNRILGLIIIGFTCGEVNADNHLLARPDGVERKLFGATELELIEINIFSEFTSKSESMLAIEAVNQEMVPAENPTAASTSTQTASHSSSYIDTAETTNEELSEEKAFYYDFQFSVGAAYYNQLYLGNDETGFSPAIALTVDLGYKDFFFESNRKNRLSAVLGRVLIGYHLWQDEENQLDIVSGNYAPGIEKKDADDNVIPELVNLKERRDDYNFGVRFSRLTGSTYMSSELVYDLVGLSHHGWVLDSYIGKVNSWGNWDVNYGIGHTWVSQNVSDYYVGVKPAEVLPGIYPYKTGSGYTLNIEFSAQYPVSENWVFEAGLNYSWLSDNLYRSPLVINQDVLTALIGFGYVF
ncbi:MipA/OmpV family protein [Aliikangiella maris]|uniref:MipA/OmpV family protein n=2 Tax=Aliikangiella maris TaxID=3162458 RepID=A0ABV3MM92_9GAMM